MTLRMQFQGPSPSETPMARYDWNRAGSIWSDAMDGAITAALRAKAPAARENGGAFKRSIRCERHASSGQATLVFGSSVSYAPYVVNPTRPHTIRPRNARMLHFTVEGGSKVFASQVNHPGTKGNPFVRTVLEAMGPEIRGALLAAVALAQGG